MKNVLSKVGLDVHKEKVLLALLTPHRFTVFSEIYFVVSIYLSIKIVSIKLICATSL